MAGIFLVSVVAVIDRLLKSLALFDAQHVTTLIPGVLSFRVSLNEFGPLGLPLSSDLFLPLAIGMLLLLFVAVVQLHDHFEQVLLFGVFVGVLSNSFDRFLVGAVIDTLHLSTGLAFNLADLLIVMGAIVIPSREFGRWLRPRVRGR